MKQLHLVVISAAFALCSATAVCASTFNFGTEEDYNSLIKTGRTSLTTYLPTGGIGDGSSLAVQYDKGSNQALYMTAPGRLDSHEPITLSLSFQWVTPAAGGVGGHTFMLGFGSNENGATLTPYTTGYNESTTGSNREEIYVGLKSGGIGSDSVSFTGGTVSGLKNTLLTGLPTDVASLTSGSWYSFTVTFTPNNGMTGFGVEYALYNLNSITGEIVGLALLEEALSVDYAGVFSDSVNPFIGIRDAKWGGVSSIDDITFTGSAIPEPSSVAILASSSLVLLALRMCRRNRL